jgi:predicted ATP-dependent endonuclease of OLD family
MTLAADDLIPPLHLVLIEEPEAHLHAQVQQVFVKQAYQVLRRHPSLVEPSALPTQLVISTHSSHIAHEADFAKTWIPGSDSFDVLLDKSDNELSQTPDSGFSIRVAYQQPVIVLSSKCPVRERR